MLVDNPAHPVHNPEPGLMGMESMEAAQARAENSRYLQATHRPKVHSAGTLPDI